MPDINLSERGSVLSERAVAAISLAILLLAQTAWLFALGYGAWWLVYP